MAVNSNYRLYCPANMGCAGFSVRHLEYYICRARGL
jgi:hypothetical protein